MFARLAPFHVGMWAPTSLVPTQVEGGLCIGLRTVWYIGLYLGVVWTATWKMPTNVHPGAAGRALTGGRHPPAHEALSAPETG